MNDPHVGRVTRRASVTALGAVGLAALTVPARVNAKNQGKDDKRCKRQVGACRTKIRAECAGDPGCLELLPCCDRLRTCKFDHFLTCLITSGAS